MKPMPVVEIEPVADVFCQELACIDHMGGAVRLTFTVTRDYEGGAVKHIVGRLVVPADELPKMALALVGRSEAEMAVNISPLMH